MKPTLPNIPSLHGCLAHSGPEPQVVTIFKNWTRFTCDNYGRCFEEPLHGLFCADTFLISRHILRLNRKIVHHRAAIQTSASSWTMIGVAEEFGETGNLPEGVIPEGCVDICVRRKVDGGMTEFVRLTNHALKERRMEVALELNCPILDYDAANEAKAGVEQRFVSPKPKILKQRNGLELSFERKFGSRGRTPSREFEKFYRGHPPRSGSPVIRRLNLTAVAGRSSRIRYDAKKKTVFITLSVGGNSSEEIRLFFDIQIDEHKLFAPRNPEFSPLPMAERDVPDGAVEFESSNSSLNLIVGQAQADLESLKLTRIGARNDGSGLIIAGIPRYIGIFARDSLMTGWQSAGFDPIFLQETLESIGQLQGVTYDPWRDEEPGRLPHEGRLDPNSLTGKKNRELYYGDVTSTPFFCIALHAHYAWNGDLHFVRSQSKVLENCCRWMLRKLEEGDGFVYYQSALSSRSGANRNQAWKDSGDAIVDEQGRICVPPLALVEIQGYVHKALSSAANLLDLLRRFDFAGELRGAARSLKRKFNDVFWDDRKKLFAFALHREGEVPIRARASNIGHCLGTGILREDRVESVVRMLMDDDMFSGWGIRTLSSKNPAFDPFSYHRGSVWPVENGEIAARMFQIGYQKEAIQVITGQLMLATLFPHFRLPEVISGHPRSDKYPFPGIYPYANLLQAWSVSSTLQMARTVFGFQPNARQKKLVVSPHFPEWLTGAKIGRLQFAGGHVSLAFERDKKGITHTRVLEKSRGIKVVEL